MQDFKLNRELAQLAILQRIELSGPILRRIRKTFGRYFFSTIASKYFINPSRISKNYFYLMEKEYFIIKKYIQLNNNILSIGSGIGGLEILINKEFNSHITFIERDYVSKKIRYGWDKTNKEAYNNLKLLEIFLENNGFKKNNFELYDYDKGILPNRKFDLIISLYSLDYHYEFNLYKSYLNKVMKPESVLIFDTVRPDYFSDIFKKVEILKEDNNTVHKSKRIACSN